MNSAKDSIVGYAVEYTIEVDRPDLRGPTFPHVAPGTRVANRVLFGSFGPASREMDRLLSGEDDFSSEYVAKVRVMRMYNFGPTQFARKTVQRDTRSGDWRQI